MSLPEYKLLIVLSCIILHYGLSTSISRQACSFWCDGSLHDPHFDLFVCLPFFFSICAISGGLACTTPFRVCHRDSCVSSTATKVRCALVILVWNHRDPLVHSFHFKTQSLPNCPSPLLLPLPAGPESCGCFINHKHGDGLIKNLLIECLLVIKTSEIFSYVHSEVCLQSIKIPWDILENRTIPTLWGIPFSKMPSHQFFCAIIIHWVSEENLF